MGISASLLLSAVGAILLWAVDVTATGVNVHMVGAILLVVGIIGFVLSLFFWSDAGRLRPRRSRCRNNCRSRARLTKLVVVSASATNALGRGHWTLISRSGLAMNPCAWGFLDHTRPRRRLRAESCSNAAR